MFINNNNHHARKRKESIARIKNACEKPRTGPETVKAYRLAVMTYIGDGRGTTGTFGREEIVKVLLTVRLAVLLEEVVRRERLHTDRTPEALRMPRLAHCHHWTTLRMGRIGWQLKGVREQ